jgi:hypothetical protein
MLKLGSKIKALEFPNSQNTVFSRLQNFVNKKNLGKLSSKLAKALDFFARNEGIIDFNNESSFTDFSIRLLETLERFLEGSGENPLEGSGIIFDIAEINYLKKSNIIYYFSNILFKKSEIYEVSKVSRNGFFEVLNT